MEYCGKRVPYYPGHSGLCMLPPHGKDVDCLVEMVTVDTKSTKYGLYFKMKEGSIQ